MARKTKEEAEKTRQAILDGAIEVFASKGVTRTGLAEIAQEAGVTRGAIYHHFENKSALLSSLLQRITDSFKPLEKYDDVENLTDPLGALIEKKIHFFKILSADEKLMKLFHVILVKSEAVDDGGTLFLHRVQCHQEAVARMQIMLEKAKSCGQLSADIDVKRAAVGMFAFMDGLIQSWVLHPELFDRENDIPLLLQSMVEMVKTMVVQDSRG